MPRLSYRAVRRRQHRLNPVLLLLLALCCSHPTVAFADAMDNLDGYGSQKQRRLNIAGWTLVGAGIAFPVIATSVSASRNLGENCDIGQCPDVTVWVTSMVLGPAMIVTGTALLLKRRGLRKQREQGEPSVMVVPGVAGVSISGRF